MSIDPVIERRIRAAVVKALRLPGDTDVPLGMGVTPGWDSMGHMSVVIELEAEFGLSFPAYRLPQLADVESIARVVQEME